MKPRAVVHLNIADFAVAIERQINAGLKERPVIVAQGGASRAVVYDMSEEAYQSGVRKLMPLRYARRRCRDAVVLPPHPERYEQAMRDLFGEVRDYSPLVEPGEIDGHFFIDITGTSRLFGPPVDVAWRMGRRIQKRFGLVPIWSVASNKLISKVASRLVKPMGEYVVGDGEEAEFIAPLPVTLLPGIEKNDHVRLSDLNLSAAGQVARLGEDALTVVFGKRAGFIFDKVRGIDSSPVMPVGREPEWVRASRVFGGDGDIGDDTIGLGHVERGLYEMVEIIGATLRRRCKAARLLAIVIDYSDGLRSCRQLSVSPPSANDINLFDVARQLLYMAWTRRVRLRGITLTCHKPVHYQPQMELFGAGQKSKKNDALINAMDSIRQKFGHSAVSMGRITA